MTTQALTSLLLLVLTAAASPFSLIAFSIVLATDRGPRNGIAFICGWVTTVTLIGVGVALLGANVDIQVHNPAGKWTLALEMALGVALIGAWARRRFRPHPHEAAVDAEPKPESALQRRLTTMGYVGAFVAGGAVQTWPVMIAAATTLLRLDLSGLASLAWMFAFAVATTAGIVVLEVLAWRNPTTAVERLHRLRNYIDTHRDSVLNWVYLVAGLWLLFHGLIEMV